MHEKGLSDLQVMSDNELFELLGRLTAPLEGGPSTESDESNGRSWYRRNLEALKRLICTDAKTERLRTVVQGDRLTDAATVFDLLMAPLGRPTAMVVAAIVARRGLAAFCKDVEL